MRENRVSHSKECPTKIAHHTSNSEAAIRKRIKNSEEAILKLETHHQKQTCPKTLRYDARAKIQANDGFKEEVKTIRKQAEQKLFGAFIKFHHRNIDSNKRHLNKVSHKKRLTEANKKAVNRSEHDSTLDFTLDKAPETNILKQQAQNIQQQFKLMQEMMSNLKKASNKDVSTYPGVLTESFNGKERISNTRKYLNNKRKHSKKLANKSITKRDEKIKSTYIRNLSNCNLTIDQINLLTKGLRFIPSPHTNTDSVKKQNLRDFNQFARRMHLRYIYHSTRNKKHPFYVKSNWEPPIQRSVTLEKYLEETKIKLSEIKITKPKPNMPKSQGEAIRQLKGNSEINIKKADKGTTTVIMNKTDKIKEGMTLIEVKEHYRPLEKPMVEETSKKVRKIITELYQKKHIDEMTFKWLSQTPNPPRIPVFNSLTKTHKVNLSSRPIISGCDSPIERISAFVDTLLQPIMKEQQSYIKDTTQFINFIEGTKVPQNATLVSMDVTSLYTNIPQEEGITTICRVYDTFYTATPPIPTHYLREMLRLILQENSFQFNGKDFLQTYGSAMGTKTAVPFANIFMAKIETAIIDQHSTRPLLRKRYINDVFSLWDTNREEINNFTEHANNYHPTIKFTANISDKEIILLDTCIYKGARFEKESILDTHTYFKPTETFQYTHFKSCQPPGVKKGFIKGEGQRLVRTNSSEETFVENIRTFKLRLRARGYPNNLIDKTLSEVKFSDRKKALKDNTRVQKEILPFVTQYNPSVPNLKHILMEKWHLIESQPKLKEMFKEPPIISYKRGI